MTEQEHREHHKKLLDAFEELLRDWRWAHYGVRVQDVTLFDFETWVFQETVR